jgi:hypothetical protein
LAHGLTCVFRQGWKDSPGRNALAYFTVASVMKKDAFLTLSVIAKFIKLFFDLSLTNRTNKLERLSQANFSSLG